MHRVVLCSDLAKCYKTQQLTLQMDDDPKHTAEITQEFMKAKKWDVLQEPSQSPDLSTTELYSY